MLPPKRGYSPEDILFVRENYPSKPVSEIAKQLERSYDSVATLAHRLQVRHWNKTIRVTLEEEKTKHAKYMRRWYQKNKERINAERRNNLEKKRRANELRRLSYPLKKLELEEHLFAILGHKCATCGFSDRRALQVDHIKGGSYRYKQAGNSLSRRWYFVRLLRLPVDELRRKYQILCANCNWIKRSESKEQGGKTHKKPEASISEGIVA